MTPPRAVASPIADHDIRAVPVNCHRPGLSADEHAGQIVPTEKRAPPHHRIRIEHPLGDGAELEGGRPQGPELGPTGVRPREARYPHYGRGQVGTARGGDRLAVPPGPSPPDRLETGAGGLIHHQPDQRPLGVEDADAGGIERHPPVRIRRTVHRVDHRHEFGRGIPCLPRLLGEHLQAGGVENRQGSRVRGQVKAVLARACPGRTPVFEPVQGGTHRVGGLAQNLK